MGFRKDTKFITYSAKTNSWQHIPNGQDWPASGRSGHVYGNNAFSSDKGEFYHLATATNLIVKYSLHDGSWSHLPGNPLKRSGIATAIEYFPEMNGKVKIHRNTMNFFDFETQHWQDLGELPDAWYHSLMRYNPKRKEILIAGGNAAPKSMFIFDANGILTKIDDSPINMGIKKDKLLIHPVTGHYLFFVESGLYDFDPDDGNFTKVEDFTYPYTKYEKPFTATIDNHKVIMFVDKKVRIYKPPVILTD
jgi:hypothetical protein